MMTTNPGETASLSGKSKLTVSSKQENGIVILKFEGDLVGQTMEVARQNFADAVEAMNGVAPRFIIDLEACEFMDSSGLGFFLGCLKKIREAQGDLKLANINAYMIGIFRLINLHYIIDCHETLEKAIASFQAS